MFEAPQNSEEEQILEHEVDAWHVLTPPGIVSLHTVVPVRVSQSMFDMQYTKIIKIHG